MGGFGWRHEFHERSWSDVRDFLGGVNWRKGEAGYLFEIIERSLDPAPYVSTQAH